MNGEYLVAGAGGKHAPFNTNYADYPLASAAASSNEFFEVRSAPIRSNYGQVYWTLMEPVPLDPKLVQRGGVSDAQQRMRRQCNDTKAVTNIRSVRIAEQNVCATNPIKNQICCSVTLRGPLPVPTNETPPIRCSASRTRPSPSPATRWTR